MEKPKAFKKPSIALGCLLGIVNAGCVFLFALGMGMSNRGSGKEPEILDVPVSMLFVILPLVTLGPLAVWLIFRGHGRSTLGAVLALLGVLVFGFIAREAVR